MIRFPAVRRSSRLLCLALALPLLAGAAWATERILPSPTTEARQATPPRAMPKPGAEPTEAPAAEPEADAHAARLALFRERVDSFRSVEARMWTTPAPAHAARRISGRKNRSSLLAVQAAAPRPRAVFAPMATQELQVAQSQGDADCLAKAVYYEARGESSAGQAAVAQVVLNRVRSPYFPKSVCGVVFQGAARSGCQFSFACDGALRRGVHDEAAWTRAQQVAALALAGSGADAALTPALNYHADYVKPKWASRLARLEKIGRHIFYQAMGAILPEGGKAPDAKTSPPPAPPQPLPAWA